jgi:ribosomal protein S18 acetylase RimI-like enzyme
MESIGSWRRRAATPPDEDFLCRLHRSTRETEVAAWGLPAEQQEALLLLQYKAQSAHYSRSFPSADHQIITIDGKSVGTTLVDRSADEIRLVDIAILPEHRNAGLGTALVRELLDESVACGKPMRLHVFKPSPAVRFYERLGFHRIGDDQVYWVLEANPGRAKASA